MLNERARCFLSIPTLREVKVLSVKEEEHIAMFAGFAGSFSSVKNQIWRALESSLKL